MAIDAAAILVAFAQVVLGVGAIVAVSSCAALLIGTTMLLTSRLRGQRAARMARDLAPSRPVRRPAHRVVVGRQRRLT
jgi:hypothetical protein